MNQTTSTADSKPNWLLRIGSVVLALAVGFIFLLFTVLMFGLVEGEEFAADTFKRRTFTYYEIPLLHWQVTGIQRDDSAGQLEEHLAKKKLIGPPNTKQNRKTRWDLVSSNRTESNSPICDANILCSYLDQRNADKSLSWLVWSKKKTELAKVLWPAVAELARRELYFFIPDLLQAAKGSSQPEPLKRQLDLTLNGKYRFLAENEQKLKQHKSAIHWFSEALALNSGDIDSLRGRAKSLQSLGKKDRAAADLAEVQRISSSSR